MGNSSSQLAPSQLPPFTDVTTAPTQAQPVSKMSKKRAHFEDDGDVVARKTKKSKTNTAESPEAIKANRAVPQHRRGTHIRPSQETVNVGRESASPGEEDNITVSQQPGHANGEDAGAAETPSAIADDTTLRKRERKREKKRRKALAEQAQVSQDVDAEEVQAEQMTEATTSEAGPEATTSDARSARKAEKKRRRREKREKRNAEKATSEASEIVSAPPAQSIEEDEDVSVPDVAPEPKKDRKKEKKRKEWKSAAVVTEEDDAMSEVELPSSPPIPTFRAVNHIDEPEPARKKKKVAIAIPEPESEPEEPLEEQPDEELNDELAEAPEEIAQEEVEDEETEEEPEEESAEEEPEDEPEEDLADQQDTLPGAQQPFSPSDARSPESRVVAPLADHIPTPSSSDNVVLAVPGPDEDEEALDEAELEEVEDPDEAAELGQEEGVEENVEEDELYQHKEPDYVDATDQVQGWLDEQLSSYAPVDEARTVRATYSPDQRRHRGRTVEEEDSRPIDMKRYKTAERGTKTGKWTEKELEEVDLLFNDFCKDNSIAPAQLKLKTTNWSTLGSFKIRLYETFKTRSFENIRKICQRRFSPYQKGQWSQEETQRLKDAYAKYPENWSKIAEEVERNTQACRDHYKHQVKYEGKMDKGAWSMPEEAKLIDIVEEAIDIIQEKTDNETIQNNWAKAESMVNWDEVASKMDGKRSCRRCQQKWTLLKRRKMMPDGQASRTGTPQNVGDKSKKQQYLDKEYVKMKHGDIYALLLELDSAIDSMPTSDYHQDSTFWSVLAAKRDKNSVYWSTPLVRHVYLNAIELYDCKKVRKAEGHSAKVHAILKRMRKLDKEGEIDLSTKEYVPKPKPTPKGKKKVDVSDDVVESGDEEVDGADAATEEEEVVDGDDVQSLRSATPFLAPAKFKEKCRKAGREAMVLVP